MASKATPLTRESPESWCTWCAGARVHLAWTSVSPSSDFYHSGSSDFSEVMSLWVLSIPLLKTQTSEHHPRQMCSVSDQWMWGWTGWCCQIKLWTMPMTPKPRSICLGSTLLIVFPTWKVQVERKFLTNRGTDLTTPSDTGWVHSSNPRLISRENFKTFTWDKSLFWRSINSHIWLHLKDRIIGLKEETNKWKSYVLSMIRSRRLLADKWMNNVWSIPVVECNLPAKHSTMLTHAPTWMNIENVTLSGRGTKGRVISLVWNL
jgi:hypothetical protein